MGRTFLCGDIHGIASNFTSRIKWDIEDPQPDDAIICLGDVGIEYGNQVQGALRKAMKKFPGTIYVMRGNHDNRYWRDHVSTIQTYDSYVERPHENWFIEDDLLFYKKYDNIKYIRDEGGVYNINGSNILFIPGAYSIDKYYRLDKGYPYEEEEQLTWVEQNNILTLAEQYKNQIDYVCSHTSPLCVQPYYKDLFLDFIDQSRVDKNMEMFLDEVYRILGKNVKRWYFGHFHDDRNISTNFTMLYNIIVKLGEKIER